MKKILILFLILFIQCSGDNKSLTKAERDFAIKELNTSRDNLLAAVENLSPAQRKFKIDKDSWSIEQCVEHITILENELFDVLKESLELPADSERRKDLKLSDQELIDHVENRSEKAKTQEDFEPNNRYGDFAATLKEFKAKRVQHVNYVSTTKDDLRNHFANFGSIDAFQAILYISSHVNRHVQQINEIKSHINFPNL